MAVQFDPFTLKSVADPYPEYRRPRDEAPVHWAPKTNAWCVSRHADVRHVLCHLELFSSDAMQSVLMNTDFMLGPRAITALLRFFLRTRINPFSLTRVRNLIAADPPRHDALRSIVNRGFTPRSIAAWEPRPRTT